jgi:signal transduction histidine kinase
MTSAARLAPSAVDTPAYRQPALDRAMQLIVTVVVFLAILQYVVSPVFSLIWLQRPFLGAFTEKSNFVNDIRSVGADRFSAFAQGLKPQDQLLTMDGVAVPTSATLAAVLARHQPGDVVTVTVSRAVATGPEQVLTLSLTLSSFALGDIITLFVIPYLIGLAYLFIGLWVFRLRRGETPGRLFALFCMVAASAIGGIFDLWTAHAFTWAWTLAVPTAGASLVTLGLVFPQEVRFVQRYPASRLISIVIGLFIAGYALYTIYGAGVEPRAYILAWRNGYYCMGVGALSFFGMVIYRSLFSPSPIAREQSRIILIGALLGFLPMALWAVAPLVGLGAPFNVPLFLFPLIFFPVGVAYAILRYRLIDTDVLLSQGMIYALIGVVTAVAYSLLVTGVEMTIGPGLQASHPLLIGLMAFALVVLINPVRARLQRALDQTFFRGTRANARQLEAFGRFLTRALTLDEISRALREQIETVVRPAHIHLFLRDPASTDYGAFAEAGQPALTDLRFAANSPLVAALSRERAPIYFAPDVPLPSALLSERVRLAVLGSAIYAPLPGQSGLAGWLAIGPKLSGEPFTRNDLRFIEALADQSALAVERATSISDLQRRVKELNVLSQMAQAVNFTVRYDDLLELVFAQTSKIVEARFFFIILKNERTRTFEYVFFVENDERAPEQERKPWPVGEGLATEVTRTGQPIRTDDYLVECRRRNVKPRGKNFKSWLGVPLNTGVETIGVMAVASTDANVIFTEDQLKVFWAIADQAASAIVKAQLFRQTEERARQLATLNEISASMASTLELDPLLQRIVQSSVNILACAAGSLYLTDEETGESVFRVTEGGAGHDLLGMRIGPGKGFVGQAIETGQPIIVNDVQSDPRWFKGTDEQTGFITRAMMVVPLRRGEKRIGAVQVLNKHDGTGFTEEDQNLLTAFAGPVAVAIENARLFTQTDTALAERVEELSVMQRIDRELNTALDVKRVMGLTLDWAMRNTHATAGFVGMTIEEHLSIIATRGYSAVEDEQFNTPQPLAAGLWEQVRRTGDLTLVRAAHLNAEAQRQPLLSSTQTLLILPILRERDVVGLVQLESQAAEAFTAEQVEFVTRLIDHASVAITNARLYAEVQAANLAKSEFVSFVAHELKTPMSSIKMSADLLLAGAVGPTNETQNQFLDTIRRNLDRLATIVTDLNDITRIETGRVRLEPKPFAFHDALESVLRTTQGLIDSKRQQLIQNIASDLPKVLADKDRTVQVLTNLLSNAYKYTPEEGTITLSVRVSETDATKLHVSIQDTGIGIAPEDQKKLFQKFYRAADQMARDMASGTGLGLNIVKNLVELQGGQIWFESVFRQGSTFHFTIPIAPQ